MHNVSLESIAQKMRHLDIATFTTVTDGGALAGRPMSNNGDVDYDGKSNYFSYEKSRVVADVGRNPSVQLGFEGDDDLYIAVSGKASLVRDKEQLKAHWLSQLDQWFPQGVDTPGVVMIEVRAHHIKYWQREEQGEWTS